MSKLHVNVYKDIPTDTLTNFHEAAVTSITTSFWQQEQQLPKHTNVCCDSSATNKTVAMLHKIPWVYLDFTLKRTTSQSELTDHHSFD
jgi:hypothetical protein